MTNMTRFLTGAAILVMGSASLAAAFPGDRPEGPRDGGPAPAPMMFRMIDADGDGQVTRAEMEAAGPAAAFAAADADGSGALEGAELTAFEEARQAEHEAMRLRMRQQRMLDRLDADKDGSLSLEELQARGPAGMFERLDADSDGTVTGEELAAARAMRDRDGDGPRGDGPRGGWHEHGREHGKRPGGERWDR